MEDTQKAAGELFKLLSGGSPTSDEFARDYDEKSSWDNFWSDHNDSTIFAYLTELCQYFGIDATKMSEFLIALRDCDYCGEHTSKVQEVDGEYVCEVCLEETR